MQSFRMFLAALFASVPLIFGLVLLVGVWRWASELLRELKTISRHLETIASTLDAKE